jgi:hypothetical protein
VNDRVPYVIALYRILDFTDVLLVRKFRAMNTDDEQPVLEALLKIPQYRNDVQAIDTAKRPEIEEYQAPSELLEVQRAISI